MHRYLVIGVVLVACSDRVVCRRILSRTPRVTEERQQSVQKLSVAAVANSDEDKVLDGAHWDLWVNEPGECDKCLDVPISVLLAGTGVDSANVYLGCPPQFEEGAESFPTLPECAVQSDTEDVQAGGHADSFYVLADNKVAKITHAFDKLPSKSSKKAKRQKSAGLTEYVTYMQFWCLRRLKDPSLVAKLASYAKASEFHNSTIPHILDPFVFRVTSDVMTSGWAPKFFGACRVQYEKKTSAYIVMENLLTGFSKPSQLDLRVGRSLEPGSVQEQGWLKVMQNGVLDWVSSTRSHGARLAGYKVWNPHVKKYETHSRSDKVWLSLNEVFQKLLDEHHLTNPGHMLSNWSNMLEEMSLWWNRVGSKSLHSIAASLLFVYEGDDSVTLESMASPVLKLIDYAHFYPREAKPNWPDDLTYLGLTSAMNELDYILAPARLEAPQNLAETYNAWTSVCGVSCTIKCPPLNVGGEAELQPFKGATWPRCQHLATTAGMEYYSWSPGKHLSEEELKSSVKHEGECRVCSEIIERKTTPRTKTWYVAQRVAPEPPERKRRRHRRGRLRIRVKDRKRWRQRRGRHRIRVKGEDTEEAEKGGEEHAKFYDPWLDD